MILKKQKNPDDIQIDHRKWIELRATKEGFKSAVSVDEYVDKTPLFWASLETDCVAACCGICAFSLWESDVQRAIGEGAEDVSDTIEAFLDFVLEAESGWFVSMRLNQLFPSESLIELLTHISTAINNKAENKIR